MQINFGFSPRLVLSSLAVMLLGLTACGGSGSSGSSSSAASSASLSSSVESSSTETSSVESSSDASSSDASSSETSASASSSAWKLVWSDDFDGSAIDASKWGFEQNCWGGGNGEQQCYTNRSDNAFVKDGLLNIVAKREDFTGPSDSEGTGSLNATLPYTSARLRTKNLAEWTFGRFEIRAKLPKGQGTWPAIWMLPTNSPYGVWAASGEIDIMEAVNLGTQTSVDDVLQPPETRVYGTLHYGRIWPGNVSSGNSYALPDSANPGDDFHVYALEWEAGEIRWYVDGVHYATQRKAGWYGQFLQNDILTDAPDGEPFGEHSAFHLLLNLAVGGAWAGNTNLTGIDESVFPQTMQVDYVRVYECEAAPTTGLGCASIDENAELNPGHERPAIGAVNFPGPPQFKIYEDSLAEGLVFEKYDPDSKVSYSELDETSRGKILNVVKTGTNGNFYFKVNGDAVDMRNWSSDSELIFDVKINSRAEGAKLLVKLDSGWPNVSDTQVPVANLGEWTEFRITLGDLIAKGNSYAAGKASLAAITNMFVIDPSDSMDVSFDNIRIEGTENLAVFAELPLYNLYTDSVNTDLQVQSYNPDSTVTAAEIDEADHGKVFHVVKTGGGGNVFFNIPGDPVDLSHWAANGKLVFEVKVNSKAADAKLLVKMDSGWPNVSDVEVPAGTLGEWALFSIDVADLIDNGNSYASGAANLGAITNLFVVEPSGAMDVEFDNIRLEEIVD